MWRVKFLSDFIATLLGDHYKPTTVKMPKKSQGRGEAARGKKLELNGWTKVESKQNKKPKPPAKTNDVFRCFKCYGVRHYAIDCPAADGEVQQKRRQNLAKHGPMPPREPSNRPVEQKSTSNKQPQPPQQQRQQQQPKTTAQTPTWADRARSSPALQTTDPASTGVPRVSGSLPAGIILPLARFAPDIPGLLVLVEELKSFLILRQEEMEARDAIQQLFCAEDPYGETICPWCAESFHRLLLPQHLLGHATGARTAMEHLVLRSRASLAPKYLAAHDEFLSAHKSEFESLRVAIAAKDKAKAAAKTATATVAEERKKVTAVTEAKKSKGMGQGAIKEPVRARSDDTPTKELAQEDSQRRPIESERRSGPADGNWEGRCAAKAILDALVFAEVDPAPFLDRLRLAQPPNVPRTLVQVAVDAGLTCAGPQAGAIFAWPPGVDEPAALMVEGDTHGPITIWNPSDACAPTIWNPAAVIRRTSDSHVAAFSLEDDLPFPVEMAIYVLDSVDSTVPSSTPPRLELADPFAPRRPACGPRNVCPSCSGDQQRSVGQELHCPYCSPEYFRRGRATTRAAPPTPGQSAPANRTRHPVRGQAVARATSPENVQERTETPVLPPNLPPLVRAVLDASPTVSNSELLSSLFPDLFPDVRAIICRYSRVGHPDKAPRGLGETYTLAFFRLNGACRAIEAATVPPAQRTPTPRSQSGTAHHALAETTRDEVAMPALSTPNHTQRLLFAEQAPPGPLSPALNAPAPPPGTSLTPPGCPPWSNTPAHTPGRFLASRPVGVPAAVEVPTAVDPASPAQRTPTPRSQSGTAHHAPAETTWEEVAIPALSTPNHPQRLLFAEQAPIPLSPALNAPAPPPGTSLTPPGCPPRSNTPGAAHTPGCFLASRPVVVPAAVEVPTAVDPFLEWGNCTPPARAGPPPLPVESVFTSPFAAASPSAPAVPRPATTKSGSKYSRGKKTPKPPTPARTEAIPFANHAAGREVVEAPRCTACGDARSCAVCTARQPFANAAPLPLSQDESASQYFQARQEARDVIEEVRRNAIADVAQTALGPISDHAANLRRGCPVCAFTCGVSNVHRVAAELADHVNRNHPNQVVPREALDKVALAQCPRCATVFPRRSAGRHRCAMDPPQLQQPSFVGTLREPTAPPTIHQGDTPSLQSVLATAITFSQRSIPAALDMQWLHLCRSVLAKARANPTPANLLAAIHLPKSVLSNLAGRKSRQRKSIIQSRILTMLGENDPRPEPAPNAQRARTEREQQIARAVLLADDGALSRAWRALAPEPLAPNNEKTVAALRELFPPATEPPLTPKDPVTLFDPTEVSAAIARLAKGACPGCSGWTRELLMPLRSDTSCLTDLTWLLNAMVHHPTSAPAEFLRLGRIIPLQKTNGDVRPIVLADALLKILGIAAVSRSQDVLKKTFEDVQFGTVSAEAAIHKIRALATDKKVLVALDIRNAFGSVLHSALYGSLQDEGLSALRDVASLEFTGLSLLLYEEERLKMSRGTRQGSTISPVAFALAIHPALIGLPARAVAYLDDICLVADSDDEAIAAVQMLEERLRARGLSLKRSKSQTNSRQVADAIACEFTTAVTRLGSCFGDAASQKAFADAKSAEASADLDRLEGVPLQQAWQLLCSQAPATMVFVARTLPPQAVTEAAEKFDSAARGWANKVCPTSSAQEEIRRSLPRRIGGFGWRPLSRIIPFAYACRAKGSQHSLTEKVEMEIRASLNKEHDELAQEMVEGPHWLSSNRAGVRLHNDAWRHQVAHALRPAKVPGLCDPHIPKGPRHDAVKLALAKALRADGHTVILEPSGLRGQARPDLCLYPSNGSKGVFVDVSIVSSRGNFAAALETAAQSKRNGYASVCAAVDHLFAPFILSTRGAVHRDAADFVAQWTSAPQAVWRQLAGTLARGNARMVHQSRTRC